MKKKRLDREAMLRGMSRQCVAVRIRMLSRMITNIYDSALSPYGVKLNQLTILIVVYLKGEIGYDELCVRLKLEKSTASRNIERVKKKGWLDVVSVKDERRRMLRVTPAGEALLDLVHRPWEEAQKKAQALLGAEGAGALCGIADTVWRNDSVK